MTLYKRYIFFWAYLLSYLFLFHLGNFTAGDRLAYFNIFSGVTYDREWGFKLIAYLLTNFSPSAELSLFVFASMIFYFGFFSIVDFIENEDKYYFFGIIFIGILSLYSIGLLRAGLANWVAIFLYLKYLKSQRWVYLLILLFTIGLHIQLSAFVLAIYLVHLLKLPVLIVFVAFSLVTASFLAFPTYLIELLGFPLHYAEYLSDPKRINSLLFSPSMWTYFAASLLLFFCVEKKQKNATFQLCFLGLPFGVLAFTTGFDHLTRFMSPFLFLTWIYFFKYTWVGLKEKINQYAYYTANRGLILASFIYAYLRHSV